MEQNIIGKQRLARLEEHDREVLKVELSPSKTCMIIGIALGILCFLLVTLLFNRFWLAVIGATLLMTGGRILEVSINYDIRKDLAEDEKIITIRKIEKLEVNPMTGSFYGSPFSASDKSEHSLFQAGYYVKIGNMWYPVRKEEFEAMQGATECEFHTAQYSHTYLDCTAIREM